MKKCFLNKLRAPTSKEFNMHISEGVLSAPILVTGGVLTAAGTAIGLRKLDYDKIAQVAVLSSAFFVASLIHINIGPAGVHLVFNGIIGLMLGWAAFPTLLVALMLQAVFFQFGGITVLGVNTLNHAFPALICYYLFRNMVMGEGKKAVIASFACGFLSVFLSGIMVALSLVFTEESFMETAVLIVTSHLPVMLIEGIVTAFCIGFIKKVHPEMLAKYH